MKLNFNFNRQFIKLKNNNNYYLNYINVNPYIRLNHNIQSSPGGKVTRGKYSFLTDTHLKYFENILGKNGLLTNEDELKKYNVDWFNSVKGDSKIVLFPKTTKEVSEILKYCNKESLAVCTQGGNTGVAGGCIPIFDEIILSTSRMNKIISLDKISGALVCQSGCILETLNEYLSDHKLIIPLDLGAKGSCFIGGNVSTNAGGLRLIRYGNLHGNILGLEAVLANGTIVDCLTVLKKDNTGYAVKNLFIGSEGTLGVVTTVAIHCAHKPEAVNVAFLGVNSYEDVLQIHRMAKNDLGEILSAFEYMDDKGMSCVCETLKLKLPFEGFPFYILIETSGVNGTHDEEKLHTLLGNVLENVKSTNGTIAADESQKKALWSLRERIPEALLKDGYMYSYDLSIHPTTFDELVQIMRNRLGSSVTRCTGFGHLGDGNVHLMVTGAKFDKQVESNIEPYIYDWVKQRKGSVSAEHGLGFLKRKYIGYSKSTESIEIMQDLKKYFDPNGILNPYKVFPCK